LAIYLAVWLGRACPLSKLNQAQKAQKRYKEKACACHVLWILTSNTLGRVVPKTQISGPGAA